MAYLSKLKKRARLLKADTVALYLAARDPRTPWYAKALAVVVVAYALSPIDLIPDFIPVIGYLDDLVLLPLGIAIVIKLIPADVLQECRQRAYDMVQPGIRASRVAAAVVIGIWLMLAVLFTFWIIGAW